MTQIFLFFLCVLCVLCGYFHPSPGVASGLVSDCYINPVILSEYRDLVLKGKK